nr:MAG TPA: hypothetical protein [Caudoviricetes sp.]
MSHPIAFGRAYLLATCFCVFSFIFPKLLYYRPSALRNRYSRYNSSH